MANCVKKFRSEKGPGYVLELSNRKKYNFFYFLRRK